VDRRRSACGVEGLVGPLVRAGVLIFVSWPRSMEGYFVLPGVRAVEMMD